MIEETRINMSDSRFCNTRHYSCTLMFPASLIAAMSFTWSSICCPPSVDITTSTSFNALTRLSWSCKSPCKNHPQGFPSKFETLPKFDSHNKKGTYIKQSDSRGLEGLNKFRLFRMRNSVLSDQHKRGMFCFCAGLNYEFSYVSCSSNNQDFALRCH